MLHDYGENINRSKSQEETEIFHPRGAALLALRPEARLYAGF
jgi:hypothetical protein